MLSIGGMVSGPSAAVEVYKYVDSKGRVYLTDRPPRIKVTVNLIREKRSVRFSF